MADSKKMKIWREMRKLVTDKAGFLIHEDDMSIRCGAARFMAPNLLHLERFIDGKKYKQHVRGITEAKRAIELDAKIREGLVPSDNDDQLDALISPLKDAVRAHARLCSAMGIDFFSFGAGIRAVKHHICNDTYDELCGIAQAANRIRHGKLQIIADILWPPMQAECACAFGTAAADAKPYAYILEAGDEIEPPNIYEDLPDAVSYMDVLIDKVKGICEEAELEAELERLACQIVELKVDKADDERMVKKSRVEHETTRATKQRKKKHFFAAARTLNRAKAHDCRGLVRNCSACGDAARFWWYKQYLFEGESQCVEVDCLCTRAGVVPTESFEFFNA